MNILIYSVNPQSPHLETDLELALKLRDQGNKVTIVRSTGQLKACLANPDHNLLICAACRSKYNRALSLSGLAQTVDVVKLPEVNVKYSLPPFFKDIDELKAFRLYDVDAGNAVATTIIGRVNKDHRFDTVKHKVKVRKELEMWVDIYVGMEEIISRIQPDEVYFFNGRFSSYHPVKSICIKKNITFYTHERGGVNNKYILRRNVLPHKIDYTIREIKYLWDHAVDERESIGEKFFNDRRNKVVQSWISFTESQQLGLIPPGFDPGRKNIAIFNSTMEEYEGMDEWVNPIYKDDNDGILNVLKSFRNNPDYMFYLRVHPNLKQLDNAQIREINAIAAAYPNVYLIKPEAKFDSYALMENADKVITFGSTMGAEATYWGKPSILLGKSTYMDLDVCYQPADHSEVVNLIQQKDLKPKNRINAVKYGYWELSKGEYYQHFRQRDLFTMDYRSQVIEPARPLKIAEKIFKIGRIRNKRDISNIMNKFKNLFK